MTRIEFTGSAYEGIKVSGTNLEFDCMLILKGGENLEKIQLSHASPGYVNLKPVSGKEDDFPKILDKNGYLSSEKIKNVFFGDIQKVINDSAGLKVDVKLRKHGPAIQMDVSRSNGKFWYSVDLVPAFEVKGVPVKELFVAKPVKGSAGDQQENSEITWRRSFSLFEKGLLLNADGADNGVRKQCARIMKVIRDRETSLQKVHSYLLKTTLFHEMTSKHSWAPDKLGERVVGLLRRLANYLDNGNLPNYFLPEMNLISDFKLVLRQNMADRINKILRSKSELSKILGKTDITYVTIYFS